LYGGKSGDVSGADEQATRAIPRQPRPDETRAIPVQPRAAAGAPSNSSTSRPTPPHIAPPPSQPGTPRPAKGGGSRRPKFRVRYLVVLLLLWVAYLVFVPFYAWHHVHQVAWEPAGARPADQPGTTYLMVGSDSRAGLTQQQRKALGTGNAAGQRTDTIILLHTGSGPNLLMSIPRDSMVDIPGHGNSKINAAFAYGGPKLLVQTIERATGIRIDDYVEIGLGGLVGVVDAVGGIQICPTQNMLDPLANLDIKKGCQQADGKTALGYARSRHTSGLGDIDRAKHQREVISAIGNKVVSPWTVLNPVRYWRLLTAIPDFFAFGDGTSTVRAGLWASAMTHVSGTDGLTCGVPISDLGVHWDPTRSKQMFQKIIADDTASIGKSLCSPTGLAN
jgi:LCP family protein required for cell wall assembly